MSDCYIIGAGDFNRAEFNPNADDFIIAADGGYKILTDLGISPDLCVGDFDSLGFIPDCPNVISVDPVEKDDTDVMLAVKQGLSRGFKQFQIFGGTGGSRADHTIANIQTLCFIASHGARGTLIGLREAATVLKNGSFCLPVKERGFVSIFSLDEVSCGVTETGLKYSLTDGKLRRDFPLGVSNEFVGEAAEISVGNGTLLIMWEI